MKHIEIFKHDTYECTCEFHTTSEDEWKEHG